MNENVKKPTFINLEDLTLQNLRKRCRFDMFVTLAQGVISWLPNRKKAWCYRGDKFTQEEARMLANLIRTLINKGIDKFDVVIIYDNDYHFQNERRTILKISAGVVEKNILDKYKKALTRVPMPDYLKQ